MFSLGADDDDLDFTPSNGAGLMSLFGKTSSSSPGGKSDSLKFSAPKQPKPEPRADSGGGSASGKFVVNVSVLYSIRALPTCSSCQSYTTHYVML